MNLISPFLQSSSYWNEHRLEVVGKVFCFMVETDECRPLLISMRWNGKLLMASVIDFVISNLQTLDAVRVEQIAPFIRALRKLYQTPFGIIAINWQSFITQLKLNLQHFQEKEQLTMVNFLNDTFVDYLWTPLGVKLMEDNQILSLCISRLFQR